MPHQVLVVDNNPVVLKAISAIVAQESEAQVETAEDGLQALEIMKTFRPDIVFTDLVMPLVDGEMLCKIIRHNETLHNTFIVIVSAVPLEQAQLIAAEIQCDLCIVKGDLQEMRSHICTALQFYQDRDMPQQKILTSATDGTVHKKSPESTFAKEVYFEKKHREEIVAYLSEGVIELNDKGKIVEINQAALDIFEREKEQVIGTSLETLGWAEAEKEICNWLDTSLKGRQKKILEFSEYEPIFRHHKVLTSSLLAIDGISYFGICIVKDITRLYRAEEYRQRLDRSLRLVKKLEAMSGMAGGVAHDFNNLLTIVCGNIDMVSSSLKSKSDNKIAYLIDQAKTSAQGAIELARKISAFSPYGIIHRETCDTQEYLQEALRLYDSGKGVTLEAPGTPLSLPITIDKELMVTALHNVLDNSTEAGSADNITVSFDKIALAEPLVGSGHYVPAGEYAKIVISDQGKGIAKANLIAVFDPYFSTKTRGNEKGLGLGLAVVYSTLRNQGGYVTIDSALNKGTSVSFYLPIAGNDAGAWPATSETQPLNRSVVVIDDDEQGRQVCTVLLEYLGYGVIAGGEGRDFASLTEQSSERKHHIVAALVNVSGDHPDRGVDACGRIHEILPDIQVIATCSSPTAPVMSNPRAYGFYSALPKPYTLDDLRNILSLSRSVP